MPIWSKAVAGSNFLLRSFAWKTIAMSYSSFFTFQCERKSDLFPECRYTGYMPVTINMSMGFNAKTS